jgi:hypothetical protein
MQRWYPEYYVDVVVHPSVILIAVPFSVSFQPCDLEVVIAFVMGEGTTVSIPVHIMLSWNIK